MADIETKIKAINEKLKKEEQMRHGAVRMKSSTSNPKVHAQCEQNIADSQRRIEYLQTELGKLQLRQKTRSQTSSPVSLRPHSGDSYSNETVVQETSQFTPYMSGGSGSFTYDSPTTRGFDSNQNQLQELPPIQSGQQERKAPTSNLDLIKSETPYSTEKVALKLHELEFKLYVEEKLLEGSLKMSTAVLVQDPKNKKSIAEVKGKTLESKEKIALLTRALHKYKELYIPGAEEDDEATLNEDDHRSNGLLKPGLRRPVTGKLIIRVNHALHLSHPPVRATETTVVIKVDGVQKAKTRVARNDRWNEDFAIHVEKASEVEITIYDKSQDHQVPIGLLWFKISDIAEELRRKRVVAGSAPDWVSANNRFEKQDNNTNPGPGDAYGIPYPATQPQGASPPDGIDVWFEVEPVGRIGLKLDFVKENRKRPADAGLIRLGAFRKKKGEIHLQNGHKFIQQFFYQIMKCAYCEELFANEGFQCDDCKLTCHKRCFQKMVTKCISKANAEMDGDYKQLNHRIPHRFEAITNISANWCCHCGYMLPLGKRGAKRCYECNITCHATCTHLVPDFCGMTMKRASDMIDQIQRATILRERSEEMKRKGQEEKLNFIHPDQYKPPQSLLIQPPPQQHPQYPISTIPQQSQQNYQHQFSQSSQQQQQPYPPPVNQIPDIYHIDNAIPPLQIQEPYPPMNQPPINQQQIIQQQQFSPPPPKVPDYNTVKKPRKVGLEDFNFLAVLGKGNFGKVMLAEEKYNKQLYAIKVLKKEFIIENDEVESTRSEKRVFQAANRERHPFLVGLHSCFQTETRIYFVMEYVSGGDLMLHIQREQFTYRRAQFYAAEVLLALEYFHKQGIVYRDLKLDNILLTLDGHIKIADYGLCKEEMWFGNTTNTFCGTPEFMAPEILLEQKYGRAVDWWAFGVLIYEMLLGQSPFRGDDEDEIFDAILEDEILYPINMSRDSVSILQRLLTRDPERRLGSGQSDAEEIKRHPFFKGVNWDDILGKKVPPPFLPSISSPTDTSNFDEEFTREVPVLTPVHSHLNSEAQNEFRGFSYVAEW
ncbi:7877_t:CDS:10 [Ambispora gerdemannii]|uniref:protein kinase C n=1 Tax=Ambispora gerdemannii TaxID=144530 RepID=A0A9N9FCL9_9GLOM|nr:7877_t:CDS:10 [Ambispora gerdemannii]